MIDQLSELIRAGFAGIWIETWEPDEALRDVAQVAEQNDWTHQSWDLARGDFRTGEATNNPIDALKISRHAGKPCLQVLVNFHRFVENTLVMQTLANAIIEGKSLSVHRIVLAPPGSKIPTELEKLFVVIEMPLPGLEALKKIADELNEELENSPNAASVEAVSTALGLTCLEAENAFALSLARHSLLLPDVIWDLKAQMLKKTGSLSLYRGEEKFDSLGGLEQLKTFARKALDTLPDRPQARGIMLLGVPGTGKSAFAKALGNEVGRPTITLDVGACYGSLVGESEAKMRQALQVADAMAPCILFIDEVEKALAGLGSQGDSGVSSRLFGTILTWLNDHTSDVFVIATSNDISKLPPEFTRAERWDGVFFIDLPTPHERSLIWQQYAHTFDVADGFGRQDWSDDGWTGAEIKACCRLSALLDIPLSEAANFIVPVATTASEKVNALREWASGKVLSASSPGIYQHKPSTCNNTKRRAIARKDV